MRRFKDEVSSYHGLFLLAISVEKRLGAKFADEDLEPVKTLRDFVGFVQRRLPADADAHSRALALVATALADVRAAGPTAPEELDLDVSIVDAIAPNRWERT
jgi:hypothetical protein